MKSKKAVLLLLLGVLACAKARTSQLSDRVDTFNESLRWASIKTASAFMDDKNKSTLLEQYSKDFQKSSIVEYSILDIGFDQTKTKATVMVEFSGYNNSTQDMSYRQELQIWGYDSKRQNWVIQESRAVSKANQ